MKEGKMEYVCKGNGPRTLKGVARIFHARGDLIGKAACGGPLFVSDGLVERLDVAGTVEEAVQCFHEGGYGGFEVGDDATLTVGVEDWNGARLIERVINYVRNASVVRAKAKPTTNEKYAFRSLMLRIGMGGPEYRDCRRALLGKLSGNAAFATDESYEKFRERRKGYGGKKAETEGAESP